MLRSFKHEHTTFLRSLIDKLHDQKRQLGLNSFDVLVETYFEQSGFLLGTVMVEFGCKYLITIREALRDYDASFRVCFSYSFLAH